MVIKQGEVYWIDMGEPIGSEPGYRHPHVVVQNNIFNTSLINTVIVCAITSNMARAKAPGNVVLQKGDANLPKKSVVNISQLFTVNKSELVDKIGCVSGRSMQKIIEGVKLIVEPMDI